MKGGVKKTPGTKTGFTIVEIMVFLAVSGLTFLIAAAFISGKEGQAEFTSGMSDANAVVTSVIDDVSNGNYPLPSSQTISCNPGASGPVVSLDVASPSVSPVGYNGCSFIGIVLVPQSSGNPNSYSEYPVVGCQFANCSTTNFLPQSLSQEKPTYVPLLASSGNWSGNSVSKIVAVTSLGSVDDTVSTGAIGIFGALPQFNGPILQAGAQDAIVAYFPGSSLSSFDPTSNTSQATMLPSGDYVVICFNGANGDKASISIGSQFGGGQLATSLGMAQKAAPQC